MVKNGRLVFLADGNSHAGPGGQLEHPKNELITRDEPTMVRILTNK